MPAKKSRSERVRAIFRAKRPRPFDRLWTWATEPEGPGERSKRWLALNRWAKRKARKAVNAQAKAAWTARKVVYRKRYRAAKEAAERGLTPTWEPWMANGRNANVVQAVKDEVAIAVVVFDCYVTSLYRATVIPQSNPNSWHGPNVSPGKAGDVGGAKRADYQRNVKARRSGDRNLLECFGPDNGACLKNGAAISLQEGTFLEQLHDTHTHVAAQ